METRIKRSSEISDSILAGIPARVSHEHAPLSTIDNMARNMQLHSESTSRDVESAVTDSNIVRNREAILPQGSPSIANRMLRNMLQ
ncbi:hypothetical protein KKF81_05805 [Candidatus Micrarchaeota archaeon]|nr:hypothetical protein [Candidatus Micrarchaeota archaeon]MBU1166444.1 hypothetical protein [Candidatus Micrarchaeota archaeon]MBU1886549.1 hypothetical protein [Candidatus Micrarchaeota archaeon]